MAIRACDARIGTCADSCQATVDDLRIGEADRNVVAGRTVLLEVAGFTDAHERIVGLLPVQGVGLQPLFTSGDAVCRWVGHNAVSSLHHVGNEGLANQWRRSYTVSFERWAGNDSACNPQRTQRTWRIAVRCVHTMQGILRNRAGVETTEGVDGSRQAVRKWLVEHVVRQLSGSIAGAASIVKEGDFKAT